MVRGGAWEALYDVVSGRPDVREAMLDRLRDPGVPPVERAGALLGLSIEAGDALRKYTIALYDLPETRASAMRAMWRSFDRGFADYLRRHLDDDDLEVRRQAIAGAGYLGLYSEASRIRKYFEDEDLRADALFAYALAVPAEISRGRMRALFRRIDAAAGPLSLDEKELVEAALDQRLAMHGLDPVFAETDWVDEEEKEEEPVKPTAKVGRNDPCPCGSGKKYKKCCGG
jgi:HEAT repeat protein